MLNALWAGMIFAGIFWAAFHGTMGEVTNGILTSAKEAVALCMTMAGIMSFWCGILKIGEEAGLMEQLTKRLGPVLRFLFPRLPKDHPAGTYIAANMIANMLGLGWAATPAGLMAMKELGKLEEERRRAAEKGGPEAGAIAGGGAAGEGWRRNPGGVARSRGTASNEMCTFLIINISSLQLIPVNIIAYRSQYGSVSPAAIVGPALAATAVSTLVGVVFCKRMDCRRGA